MDRDRRFFDRYAQRYTTVPKMILQQFGTETAGRHYVDRRFHMDNLPEKVDKEELEDMALALSDAGWTSRAIAQELGISKNSVKPYKERATARIPIPNREEIQRLNVRVTNKIMADIQKRLDDPNLPITATNVPNLYQNLLKALRAQTEALGYVGTGAAARELGIGIGETVVDLIRQADETGELQRINDEYQETRLNDEGVYVPVEEGDANDDSGM